jgi:hypothetical protein
MSAYVNMSASGSHAHTHWHTYTYTLTYMHTYTHTLTLSHTRPYAHSHSHTHAHTHALRASVERLTEPSYDVTSRPISQHGSGYTSPHAPVEHARVATLSADDSNPYTPARVSTALALSPSPAHLPPHETLPRAPLAMSHYHCQSHAQPPDHYQSHAQPPEPSARPPPQILPSPALSSFDVYLSPNSGSDTESDTEPCRPEEPKSGDGEGISKHSGTREAAEGLPVASVVGNSVVVAAAADDDDERAAKREQQEGQEGAVARESSADKRVSSCASHAPTEHGEGGQSRFATTVSEREREGERARKRGNVSENRSQQYIMHAHTHTNGSER